MNGLVAIIIIGLGLLAYVGWFHFRPKANQLQYENAQLRRTLENVTLGHQRTHPIFNWTMDHKPDPVQEARMKERLDRVYESWYQ